MWLESIETNFELKVDCRGKKSCESGWKINDWTNIKL